MTDTLGPQTLLPMGLPALYSEDIPGNRSCFHGEAGPQDHGKSARRLGLVDRGLVRVGAYADLVLFDAKTIKEGDILGSGSGEPSGIKQVWINGNLVLEHGTRKSALRNGRIMRSGT